MPGGVKVGTACSGTDLILKVLSDLMQLWGDKCGVYAKVHHVFAVEKEPFKRNFILQHWSPDHLFDD
eukprot:2751996-Pyramimonas_sp.AAC.1